MMELILKILMTIVCLGFFLYGLNAIKSGRVYCKGRWYERSQDGFSFWITIALYVFAMPTIVYLVWSVAWKLF
jgi:hypothetical protein